MPLQQSTWSIRSVLGRAHGKMRLLPSRTLQLIIKPELSSPSALSPLPPHTSTRAPSMTGAKAMGWA